MNRNVFKFSLWLLLLIPALSYGTAQAPDIIKIDGKTYELNTNPLASKLKDLNWIPPKEAIQSSGNWRSYIAHWEIKHHQLILNDVTIEVDGPVEHEWVNKSIFKDIFPSAKTPFIAIWYSGALIVPDGKLKQYVHMGYGSTYEKYIVIRINSGKVIEHLSLSLEQFNIYKRKKFDQFAKTDEFKLIYKDLERDAKNLTKEERLGFIESFYAEQYLSM